MEDKISDEDCKNSSDKVVELRGRGDMESSSQEREIFREGIQNELLLMSKV